MFTADNIEKADCIAARRAACGYGISNMTCANCAHCRHRDGWCTRNDFHVNLDRGWCKRFKSIDTPTGRAGRMGRAGRAHQKSITKRTK